MRPRKPEDAESLGFSDSLWRLTQTCWNEFPSTRPTAQQLLHCLQDISPTWVPPVEYPIPDHLGVGTLDFTPGDDRMASDVLTNNLFVLVVSMLCVLLLPLLERVVLLSCPACITSYLVPS